MISTEERRQKLLSRTATRTLMESARALEALRHPSEEERMVRAWVFDEIEKRAGEITLAEEPLFERVYDRTGSYLAALLTVRPELDN